MRINDGAFVAARDGRLVLGHVDHPFDLWQADAGILVLLAEISRGTGPDELGSAVAAGRPAVDAALARLRQAQVVVDEPQPALRDVNVEIAKAIAAAPDLHADPEFMRAARSCEGLTLTSPAAQYALWSAVRYLVSNGIPGALVECGVWRGGSMLLSALALLGTGTEDRDLYLFDTFDWKWEQSGDRDGLIGQPPADAPSAETRPADAGTVAAEQMSAGVTAEQVFRRIAAGGYPAERIRCVTGLVQDTVPDQAPERIALLRLDTDQYDSTLHELRELYPRVSPGGVVIIDDYGKLAGATRATDEYLAELEHPPLLHRMDTQGRIFIKPDRR
ncbi:TylF/MycF/NovP-related O-methyltransferase [Kitasatospora sp. NBC_01266]|uniref:TylF/MycF/NovP-related O-methyltransferase n=1 Tax=Kitasatospora sp. NBC_01266 TaxID=2903572 RepID=UPI002E34351E|nr:TylF/MycF/NovP-related O-methyltransferase [Kitasatospora sp. NBC_01266]